MLRNDDQMHAETLGHAQNRAEVLRIGDAVEDEDEVCGISLDDLLETGVRRLRDIRDDAVVHPAPCRPVNLLGRKNADWNAGLLGSVEHAIRVRAFRDGDVVDALPMRSDRFQDRIDAVDDH